MDLFEIIEDAVGVGEVPVEEELVDDCEVLAGLGEAREDLLHVALGFFLDEPAQPGEEPGLPGGAPKPGGTAGSPEVEDGRGSGGGEEGGEETRRGR